MKRRQPQERWTMQFLEEEQRLLLSQASGAEIQGTLQMTQFDSKGFCRGWLKVERQAYDHDL